jgi:hypothetical protein
MPCDPPQQTLVDIVRKAIPHDLAIVDRGRSSIDLACWIAEDNIPRLMTHGIVVEIPSEADVRVGNYGRGEVRNEWSCEIAMRHYLPEDINDQNIYIQDIQWLQNNGMIIPEPKANMQDACVKLMVAIKHFEKDGVRLFRNVISMPTLQRAVINGQQALALRVIKIQLNPDVYLLP